MDEKDKNPFNQVKAPNILNHLLKKINENNKK